MLSIARDVFYRKHQDCQWAGAIGTEPAKLGFWFVLSLFAQREGLSMEPQTRLQTISWALVEFAHQTKKTFGKRKARAFGFFPCAVTGLIWSKKCPHLEVKHFEMGQEAIDFINGIASEKKTKSIFTNWLWIIKTKSERSGCPSTSRFLIWIRPKGEETLEQHPYKKGQAIFSSLFTSIDGTAVVGEWTIFIDVPSRLISFLVVNFNLSLPAAHCTMYATNCQGYLTR